MAMGYITSKNIIIVTTTLLLSSGCTKINMEKQNIQKDTKMISNFPQKVFDINKYESELRKNSNYEGYWKDENIFVKQYHIIKEGYIEEGYTKDLVENYIEEEILKNRLRDIYIYSNQGVLQSIKHYFGNNLEIGEWATFKNGILLKKEDKEENYKFKFIQVLEYCKNKNMDLLTKGEIAKRKIDQNYIWEITWNTGIISENGESYLFKNIMLDGTTGKEIRIKEYYFNPLVR